MLKYIVGGILSVVAIVVVLMWAGLIPGLRSASTVTITRANITVWGIDDEKIFTNIAAAYKGQNSGIKITYTKKSPGTYEADLLRAFAAGTGPDLFEIHHTWLAKYPDILSPAPHDLFPLADFRQTFVDVAGSDFATNTDVYGAPLYVDTLALYYNVDLFNSASIVYPPADWDAFVKDSRQLTHRSQLSNILISGAAMGAGKNVENSSDALALLMLQDGSPIADKNGRVNFKSGTANSSTSAAEKALQFYTSFARQTDPNYSWSGSGKDSAETAFAQNRVGMILGYSDTRARLLAASPKLRFSVAPVPQPKDVALQVNYADYWGFGVYKNSPNARAAWEFLKYMTSSDINTYYLTATGRPAAQKDLIVHQQEDPQMKAFANQALSALTWIQLDANVIKDVFTQMIDTQLTSDQSFQQTLSAAESKINATVKHP